MSRAVVVLLLLLIGCSEPRRLPHDAWVWRRDWTPSISRVVAAPPPELDRLRVLAVEHERGLAPGERRRVVIQADRSALAASARPVIATWRIAGTSALDGSSIEDVVAVARSWRDAGVDVVGIEIDHDCATGRLEAYAGWLASNRVALRAIEPGWVLGVTALPTWREAPAALARVGDAVDEMTVQLHAVAAPRHFEPDTAVAVATSFARAAGRDVTVALPTYAARVAGGPVLRVDARDVARVLVGLREVEAVTRISFFRLGGADEDVFGPTTLTALVRGGTLAPDVVVAMVPMGEGVIDVFLENRGNADGPVPARVALGAVDAAEGGPGVVVAKADGGDRTPTSERWEFAIPAGGHLAAGARHRLGWVRPRTRESP